MLSFLKDHPFAVSAFFESSLVLTYAVPREELQPLIPECLQLDTFEDKWAFVAVAMVQTRHLRPKGFPAFMGNDFFLTGYRIFVRYTTSTGKRLRGLYIIRSQTDKKKMEFFGNIFTHYNYTTIDIARTTSGNREEIVSKASGLKIVTESGEAGLPEHSPFPGWKEARRYAGPLPFTFTYNEKKKEVLIIEGVREHWEPAPVKVVEHKVAFLDELKLNGVQLANAFLIKDIPYYWKKGRKDLWKP
jgi:hypothetical protein